MAGIEILSVSLSDESLEKVAQRVAQLLGNQGTTQSNPPSSQTHRTRSDGVSGGQADPWTGAPPADDGGWPQGSQPRQDSRQQPYQAPPEDQAPAAPQCRHGEMRFVPAGFSKSTGKAYNAFYGCPAPRGATDKCKSVSA